MKYTIIFAIILQFSCTKTPSTVYVPIPNEWKRLENPSKLYPPDFRGPYECDNKIAKCISNTDLVTEMKIKAQMIEAIRNLVLMIEKQQPAYNGTDKR